MMDKGVPSLTHIGGVRPSNIRKAARDRADGRPRTVEQHGILLCEPGGVGAVKH